VNTNNGVKWRFIGLVPNKVELINDYLSIYTYKSNTIKDSVNERTVNDSEMCAR